MRGAEARERHEQTQHGEREEEVPASAARRVRRRRLERARPTPHQWRPYSETGAVRSAALVTSARATPSTTSGSACRSVAANDTLFSCSGVRAWSAARDA